MTADLDTILSGNGATAPEPAAPEPNPAPEPAPASNPAPSEGEPSSDEQGHVPVAALTAEREKGKKRYTEAVADFERRLVEADQRWEQRFNQLVGATRLPVPQPEQKPIDIWETPDKFVRHEAMQVVDPIRQVTMGLAREVAELRYTPDTVKAAEAEFNRLAMAGQLDPNIHQKINGSANPFAAAVEWYQQTKTLAEIGTDPAAYKAKMREELKAELLAELQAANPAPAADAAPKAPPVMPSNFATGRNAGSRSGPQWSGPKTLDDILGRQR